MFFFSGDLIGILGDFMGISGDLMGNYGTTWGYYCNFWEFLGTSWDIKPTVYTLATGGLDWSCYLNWKGKHLSTGGFKLLCWTGQGEANYKLLYKSINQFAIPPINPNVNQAMCINIAMAAMVWEPHLVWRGGWDHLPELLTCAEIKHVDLWLLALFGKKGTIIWRKNTVHGNMMALIYVLYI